MPAPQMDMIWPTVTELPRPMVAVERDDFADEPAPADALVTPLRPDLRHVVLPEDVAA